MFAKTVLYILLSQMTVWSLAQLAELIK